MRIFFSHPISTYCSTEEEAALQAIEAAGHEAINPSDGHVQAQCGPDMQKWAALATAADAVAFLPFADGRIGAGVQMEVSAAWEAGKPVFEVKQDGSGLKLVREWPGQYPLMTLEETREVIGAFKRARQEQGLAPIPTRTPAARKARP